MPIAYRNLSVDDLNQANGLCKRGQVQGSTFVFQGEVINPGALDQFCAGVQGELERRRQQDPDYEYQPPPSSIIPLALAGVAILGLFLVLKR